MDYAKRCEQVLDSVDADAFLVVHLETTDPDSASMFYLTGYSGFGVLVLKDETTHAYASPTNIGMASEEAPHLDWQLLDWNYQHAIVSLLKDLRVRRVALASRRIGMLTWRALEAAASFEFIVSEDPVATVRSVKDPSELAAVREATAITEAALEEVIAQLRPGMTEVDVSWRLERAMRERGADGLAFDLIVSAGPHSALPHHTPSDRALREGDVLLFDIGARYHGYCSDITRVISIGRAPEALREIYPVVLEANRAGIDAFAPGVSGETVDRAARDVIERAGFGDMYPHGLSHGVGIEVHELPVSRGVHAVSSYEPGMVCTAEPAIYLEGIGGIRIEDLLVVTREGCDVISRFPKDKLICIG